MSASTDQEPIHSYFGLSYANYLVVPRGVLQSMPQEWQARFVGCLEELGERFPELPWPEGGYHVLALARSPQLIHEDCGECGGDGTIIDDEVERDCSSCEGTGESDEMRYETPEEVGVITDTIPRYNRGRTVIEPPGGPRG